MKYTILLLISIISTGFLYAQEPSIIQSKVFEDEHKTTLLFAEETVNDKIVVVRNFLSRYSRPLGYYVETYDKNLELISRGVIEVDKSDLQKMYLRDGKIVLIDFRYLRKEKSYAFYAITSPIDNISFSETKLLEVDRSRIDKYDHFGIRKEPEYNIHDSFSFGSVVVSENKQYVGVNLFVKEEKSNLLEMSIFNVDFKNLHSHTLNVTNEDSSRSIPVSISKFHEVEIDDQGNAFVLTKSYKKVFGRERKNDLPDYSYKLIKASPVGKADIRLELEEKFVAHMSLAIKNDQIFCVGLYAEDTSNSFNLTGKTGIIRYDLDAKSFEIINSSTTKFSSDLMEDIAPKNRDVGGKIINAITGRDSMDKAGVYGYIPRDLTVLSNNDIVIELEQFFITIGDRNMSFSCFYGDIILLRLGSDGALTMARGIKKSTATSDWDEVPLNSFAGLHRPDEHHLFFNAKSEEQLDAGRVEYVDNDDLARIYHTIITKDGIKSTNAIFNSYIRNWNFEFHFAKQLNNNTLLVETSKNGFPQLFKIILE
ncbi:hypothetical protein [Luteirhabdus pelagi]|uniref:hypothetical protein n=1 Tax=Luteirhabdus pelagi TaxID=2792783 RepID=UPI00193980E1|nr:hypothetical protein [Luteirhabdus pelagi]